MHLTLCSFVIAACALTGGATVARKRALRAGEGEAAGSRISVPGEVAASELAHHTDERGQQHALQASSAEEIAAAARAAAVGVLPAAGADDARDEETLTADLPYSAFLFQLDLCMLSYHMYAQLLQWPRDPFYHHIDTLGDAKRSTFMSTIRKWWSSASPDAVVLAGDSADKYDPVRIDRA